ncbi:exosortase A [Halorhodospira sp. 9621]|uniref:exosortase A n=1 Tax=Halorhodospira TaxID=85108 RepID=UPI001EE8DAC2|nr:MULTISPECIES: exosortase A [Halorhodospira]MCG5528459.1 exosortase A [Halorhodospira halophila]MCG5532253.1 exosortase A [Halorhodospira sp. 9621]MCG5544429.1 exosortase A [Halorhodospira sp. 9628]
MDGETVSTVVAGQRSAWKGHLAALAVAGLVLAVAFFPTYQSIVGIWSRSETFAHGFLIVPIVLFLVFRLRHELARVVPQVQPVALLPVLGLVLGWVLGALVDVDTVRHFAAVLLVPALVWLFLGNGVAWILVFPLAYLFFAVPFGDFLVPPLMDVTADFTVWAVQMTGIPVYREGLNFELPTGRWSVVEACSGVRYLIATLALGTLYAYLVYRSWMRRLLFVLASALVPIIANGLRAYLIVMIGHLSDMELAAGVDHLVYGWIFFGFVIALLFWIGTFWREDGPGAAQRRRSAPAADDVVAVEGPVPARAGGRLWLVALTGVALVGAGPLYAHWMHERDLGAVSGLQADGWAAPGWEPVEVNAWVPGYRHARETVSGGFVDEEGIPVGIHVGYYREQHRHGSMVGWENTLDGRDRDGWSRRASGRGDVDGWPRPARYELSGPGERLLVWRWYWVDGHLTRSAHEVKFRESLSRLFGGRDDAALLILYARYDSDPAEVEPALRRYAEQALPQVLDTLEQVQQH